MSASLLDRYRSRGAILAEDGIPLHFGSVEKEYQAALHGAVLLDRSHEGRLAISGEDRFALPQRMSTNDLTGMASGEGRPTIFTTPTGRIIDRVEMFHWREDSALMLSGPGRGGAVQQYLQRNIFFNDKATLRDLASSLHHFSLHGERASQVLEALYPGISSLPVFHGLWISLDDLDLYAFRLKPLAGTHWAILTPHEQAPMVWETLLNAGHTHGLEPSGGILYNLLRVRAGVPGVGRELSGEYIPLEVGLWDEISFQKGCYTGQEIIARMESRRRLARTIVRLDLNAPVTAPAEAFYEGRKAGLLTSSVVSPLGERFAIAIVKASLAHVGTALTIGDSVGIVTERLGVQPQQIQEETEQPSQEMKPQ